jgi:hypothetical protein
MLNNPRFISSNYIYLSVCLSVCLSTYLSIYGSTAICWTLAAFQLLDRLDCRWDSLDGGLARRKDATCTQDSTNTEQTHTDIHALNGIRIYDSNVRASEDISCLRPGCHSVRRALPPSNLPE